LALIKSRKKTAAETAPETSKDQDEDKRDLGQQTLQGAAGQDSRHRPSGGKQAGEENVCVCGEEKRMSAWSASGPKILSTGQEKAPRSSGLILKPAVCGHEHVLVNFPPDLDPVPG